MAHCAASPEARDARVLSPVVTPPSEPLDCRKSDAATLFSDRRDAVQSHLRQQQGGGHTSLSPVSAVQRVGRRTSRGRVPRQLTMLDDRQHSMYEGQTPSRSLQRAQKRRSDTQRQLAASMQSSPFARQLTRRPRSSPDMMSRRSAGSSRSVFDYAATGLPQYAPQGLHRQSDAGWYVLEREGELLRVHAASGVVTCGFAPHVDVAGLSDATRRRLARKQVEAQIRADLQQEAAARKARALARRREEQERARRRHESELALRVGLRVACGVGSVLHGATTRQRARDEANVRQGYSAATVVQAWARGFVARRAHAAKLRAPIKVFALLGGPGSGKSTYCKRLEAEFESLHHISVGELLRDACSGPIAMRHKKAEMIRVMMDDGVHVPSDLVLEIMGSVISRLRFRRRHEGLSPPVVLLDNYPLTETQRYLWEAHPVLPKFAGVIYLDCSEETMIQRVCARASETQRSDDNEATVATAIAHFRKRCKEQVVAYYQSAGVCTTVDSGGADVDEGYHAMRTALLQAGLARDMVRVDGEWR